MAPSIPPLLWAAALLLLSRSAPAVEVAPFLLVLRGPLGVALVALAAGVALARAGSVSRVQIADPGPRVLFAVAAVFYVVAGLWYTSRLRVSGDEPHYLVMARSLWREGDLDLRDNYEREDWRQDTPGPVRPHYGASRRDGRPFPAHSPGLPLLLAPVDALAGRAGCVVVLSLLAAWLTVEVRALARRYASPSSEGAPRLGAAGEESAQDSRAMPGMVAWLCALGPPVAPYAFHIYTEVPSALALAVAFARLTPAASMSAATGAAVAASALPWLHVKMAPAAVALGIVGWVRLRGRPRLAFLTVSAAMAAAYLAYYFTIFGRATPLALYGGVPADASGSPLLAAVGLLFDRAYGLLPHAPAFVVAIVGLRILVRGLRSEAWPLLLVAGAVLLPVLPWRMWWGGQCPPGRFLVPLVPRLAVALAAAARPPARGLTRWLPALTTFGFGLFLFAILDPGRLLLVNRANLPPRLWAALDGARPLERYLPALARADPFELRVAVVWLAALALVLVLDAAARQTDRADRWFRGFALPVVVFVGIGLAVDYWARDAEPTPPTDGLTSAARPRQRVEGTSCWQKGSRVRQMLWRRPARAAARFELPGSRVASPPSGGVRPGHRAARSDGVSALLMLLLDKQARCGGDNEGHEERQRGRQHEQERSRQALVFLDNRGRIGPLRGARFVRDWRDTQSL
jgi:hypothetical protein